MMNQTILEIKDLRVSFNLPDGKVSKAVDRVSLKINQGEILALVGASGSGKSLTALSIMGLLPSAADLAGGEITFESEDLLKASQDRMRQIRGNKISLIFQEPKSALNPVFDIAYQMEEVLSAHTGLDKASIVKKIENALMDVGLSDTKKIINDYPHQLSGGMCQRVMIAQALLTGPRLLIADEPTSNLDVTFQAEILELLKKIREKSALSILLISHDLALVSNIADRIAVIQSGTIVETGSVKEIFNAPKHPYTKQLLDAVKI